MPISYASLHKTYKDLPLSPEYYHVPMQHNILNPSIFVIYYIITMMGEKLVTDGVWAPIYGVWLSSFVLFPLAIFLTYKSTTDSQLLNMEWYILKIKMVKEFFDRFVKVKNK